MATRTKVRETIIQILYSFDMGNIVSPIAINEVLEDNKIRNKKKEFAQELVYGIVDNLENIDISIDKYLIDWDFDRIGYIERAIFRLGVYEILYNKTQGAIVIDELLSIAKEYCVPKSISFINGVLNSIFQAAKDSLKTEASS